MVTPCGAKIALVPVVITCVQFPSFRQWHNAMQRKADALIWSDAASGLQVGGKQAAVASSAASHTLSGSGSVSVEEEVPMPVSQLLLLLLKLSFLFAHKQYQNGRDLNFRR